VKESFRDLKHGTARLMFQDEAGFGRINKPKYCCCYKGLRPISSGMQNIPSIPDAAEKAGTQWLVAEQDRPNPGKEPMDEVKISRDYLKSLGY